MEQTNWCHHSTGKIIMMMMRRRRRIGLGHLSNGKMNYVRTLMTMIVMISVRMTRAKLWRKNKNVLLLRLFFYVSWNFCNCLVLLWFELVSFSGLQLVLICGFLLDDSILIRLTQCISLGWSHLVESTWLISPNGFHSVDSTWLIALGGFYLTGPTKWILLG